MIWDSEMSPQPFQENPHQFDQGLFAVRLWISAQTMYMCLAYQSKGFPIVLPWSASE